MFDKLYTALEIKKIKIATPHQIEQARLALNFIDDLANHLGMDVGQKKDGNNNRLPPTIDSIPEIPK